MSVRVASASETVACERATMATGIKSAELMARAGEAAARESSSGVRTGLGMALRYTPVAAITAEMAGLSRNLS